ncbi:MAG: hypothetical protein WCZ90_08385 [Melioribacteraceae bacterium]
MNCLNKNHVIDFYFLEKSETELAEIRNHISSCENCQEYLKEVKQTMGLLTKMESEKPSEFIFENILKEIEPSVVKPAKPYNSLSVIPILQIAFGQIFLITLIYLVQTKLTISTVWESMSNSWFVQAFGSIGVAFAIVLCIGIFIALSISPVLLFESNKNKSFS